MGGMRWFVLCVALVAVRTDAIADNAQAARTLFKQGIEEYKAKKYGEASITLPKSYELDPKPDTLFALAQAERFDNRCADAIEHYKKLLEQTTDLPTAKAVQSNVDLCVPPEPVAGETPIDKPAVCETPKPVDVKPKIETRTVTRVEQRTHKLATGLFAGGGVAIGGSIALFMLAGNSRDDADQATSLAESNRLYDRSVDQKRLSFLVGGVGLGLVAGGVVRILMTQRKESRAQVTVAPTVGGAAFQVMARW